MYKPYSLLQLDSQGYTGKISKSKLAHISNKGLELS